MNATTLLAELKQMEAERNAALATLDEGTIRAFGEKWKLQLADASNPEVFWGSVHKAITGIKALPLGLRLQSKAYLNARGLRSYDDGELG